MSEIDQVISQIDYMHVECIDVNAFETDYELFEAFMMIQDVQITISHGQFVSTVDEELAIKLFLTFFILNNWPLFIEFQQIIADFSSAFVGEDVEAILVMEHRSCLCQIKCLIYIDFSPMIILWSHQINIITFGS